MNLLFLNHKSVLLCLLPYKETVRTTECVSFFFYRQYLRCSPTALYVRFSYGLSCNARSNFRLKRSETNISCTYMYSLTTVINVSQKKSRFSQISPEFVIAMPAQNHFRIAFSTRALRRTTLSLSLSRFILPQIIQKSARLSLTPESYYTFTLLSRRTTKKTIFS